LIYQGGKKTKKIIGAILVIAIIVLSSVLSVNGESYLDNSNNFQNPSEKIINSSRFDDNEPTPPYSSLNIEDIKGGISLSIKIKNNGNTNVSDIQVILSITGGFFIRPRTKYNTIPLLKAGKTTEIKTKVFGFGLGILAQLPEVKITISSPNTTVKEKRYAIKILGPFVKKEYELLNENESFKGYTLFAPDRGTSTYLINNSGDIIYKWDSTYTVARSVYLLENGHLLRCCSPGINPTFWGGGVTGRVEEFDLNGTVVWEFEYSTDIYCLHHDIEILPSGNILMSAWEYKNSEEAIAAGRDPKKLPMGQLWPDHIIEVEPTKPSGGNIVWEWHVWDHLIQDFDPTKDNYGVVEDHPELFDVNFGGQISGDWNHLNSIDYNKELNQILISLAGHSEIWIIDHSTTTEQAAGHTGGNSGKGGDILYRWGNPRTYRAGGNDDQKLFFQHDAQWIENGYPGEGNIIIFNNGLGRPDGKYSSIDVIVPPIDNNGSYNYTQGSSYEPEESVWTYTSENPIDFYASYTSGVQRLPNGNTLICNGPEGFFFEVTLDKKVVWQYTNPYPSPSLNRVFKIRRYSPEYPGIIMLIENI